jgi:hypothetical protein
MLKVAFLNQSEIRMGSPFNECEIQLSGDWIPNLGKHDWQDVTASSPDQRFVALVYWDASGNQPGFHLVTIDLVERSVTTSDRYLGCCTAIKWLGHAFYPEVL